MEAQMKAQDLRIGNILNYQTSEGDILPTKIDWQDMKWVSEDENGFNLCHSAIPLTEEILLKCGFGTDAGGYVEYENQVELILNTGNFILPKELCTYVHQLQNLYHALTGQELNIEL